MPADTDQEGVRAAPATAVSQPPKERRPEFILVLADSLNRPIKQPDLERVCQIATGGSNTQWLGAVTVLLSRGYLEFANPDNEAAGFNITSRGRVEANNYRDRAQILEAIKGAPKPK